MRRERRYWSPHLRGGCCCCCCRHCEARHDDVLLRARRLTRHLFLLLRRLRLRVFLYAGRHCRRAGDGSSVGASDNRPNLPLGLDDGTVCMVRLRVGELSIGCAALVAEESHVSFHRLSSGIHGDIYPAALLVEAAFWASSHCHNRAARRELLYSLDKPCSCRFMGKQTAHQTPVILDFLGW